MITRDATKQNAELDRLMRRREVEHVTGFGRSTIYFWMSQGRFPKPIKCGRAVAWKESDIAGWIEAQGEVAA